MPSSVDTPIRPSSDGGFATIQYVAATGMSLLLFMFVANLLVDLYARAAVRDALEEGVRSAVPVHAGNDGCVANARDVIRSIAGGGLVRVDDLTCAEDGDRVVASARVSLKSWFPALVPDWQLDLRAEATHEQ